jgi:hypothetical protein
MHCFYHPEREAVGLCKSCSKGICTECAVDLDRGLACRGRCEDKVRKIIEVTDLAYQRADKLREPTRAVQQQPNQILQQRKAKMKSGAFYGYCGILLIIAGCWHDSVLTNLMGVIFIIYSIQFFYRAYQIWKQSKKPEVKNVP